MEYFRKDPLVPQDFALALKESQDRGSGAPEHLPASLYGLTRNQTMCRDYPAGAYIVGPGNRSEDVRYMVSGRASLILKDHDEQSVAVDTLGPGDVYGEVGVFTGSPWPSDSMVLAEETCRVLEIPPEVFEELLRTDPDLTLPLVKRLVRKIIRLDREVFDGKLQRRALKSLISREEHVFPEFVVGKYVRRRVERSAAELTSTIEPVLIVGEPGVGKEWVAHQLFQMSDQSKEVFLQVDLQSSDSAAQDRLGMVDEEERSAELTEQQHRLFFGSEEPGDDGRVKEIPGYFEIADGGTLLVRGVERLTRVMQLRVLEASRTGTFVRSGGVHPHRAKVKLLFTTRLGLNPVTAEAHPLIRSLETRSLIIPPLRSRRRETPLLADAYLRKYCQELNREFHELPEDTVKTLVNYSWPGNDLELSTTLKRALLVSERGRLTPRDILFGLRQSGGGGKFNLFRIPSIRGLLSSPLYPFVFQAAGVPLFALSLMLLLLGPSDPLQNPIALMSWAFGWPVLILGAFLVGRSWCSLCPIGLLGSLGKKIVALERPFPARLKNISAFLLAAGVVLVIWFEAAAGIRERPFILGLFLLGMLLSAVVISMIFERETWCLHLCALGGMVGALSKASIVELRADRNVCISRCASNDCLHGTETNQGCPFGQAGPRLQSNRVCKICGSCVKNCPHGAINFNLRYPGQELWDTQPIGAGPTFLASIILSAIVAEMIVHSNLASQLAGGVDFGHWAPFTAGFVVVIAVIMAIWYGVSYVSSLVYGEAPRKNFARFGLALLPLTLGGLLAYHVYYLIGFTIQIPLLVSLNFDFAEFRKLATFTSPSVTLTVQRAVIWIGAAWALIVAIKVGRAGNERIARALVGTLPHALLILGFCAALLAGVRLHFWAG